MDRAGLNLNSPYQTKFPKPARRVVTDRNYEKLTGHTDKSKQMAQMPGGPSILRTTNQHVGIWKKYVRGSNNE